MPLIKVPKTVAKKPVKKTVKKTVTRRKVAKPTIDSANAEFICGVFPPDDVIRVAYEAASMVAKLNRYGESLVGGHTVKYLGAGISCAAFKVNDEWVIKVLHQYEKWDKSVQGIRMALKHVGKHVPSCTLVKGTKRTVMIQEFLLDKTDDIHAKVVRLSKKCSSFNLSDVRGGNVGLDKNGILKIMDFGNYNVR